MDDAINFILNGTCRYIDKLEFNEYEISPGKTGIDILKAANS